MSINKIEYFDTIIIGAGAGLTNLAIPASNYNKKICIIESEPLGGTCLNRGCIPTKLLIHYADVVKNIEDSSNFYIEPNKIEIDFIKVVHDMNQIIEKQRKRNEEKVKELTNITLIHGEAKFIDKKILKVNERIVTSNKIFLCIGGRPSIPPIEGIHNVPYITSTEALKLDKKPKNMCIIGGGYIGVEMAFFF
jgi:mycothione reductase